MRSVVRKRSYGCVTVFWLDREEALRRLGEAAVGLLADRPEVRAVYLFGSRAADRAVLGSDADVLLILSHAEGRWFERADPYRRYFQGVGLPLELFCYTVEEAQQTPLARRALRQGLLLPPRHAL
ncbi:MAG: nucleotidyltransferase domain-containing protein [candidate division GAL15 bacterium]